MPLNSKFVLILLSCTLPAYSQAAAVTDGTLGASATLSGHFTVGQALGKTVGTNLFHSFTSFNINKGESATFTGSNTIQNVFSRVTGDSASHIDGLLRSTVGNADFYFINPQGVVFGKNAQLDVPASFRVSTADQLRFQDGKVFNASQPTGSSLSALPPQAYGFLGNRSSDIAFLGDGVNKNNYWQGTQLKLVPNHVFELVAGKISINNTQLLSEAGNLRLIALQSAGSVPLSVLPTKMDGNITIKDSWLDSSGNGAGFARLGGGNVSIANSYWYADNTGKSDASEDAGIDFQVNNLEMTGSSRLTSDANADGDAAHVNVEATGDISLDDASQLHSSTFGAGHAGVVLVKANQLTVNNGAYISSNSSWGGSGNAGSLTVVVNKALTLINQGSIGSITRTNGNGGTIKVSADSLTIDGKGSSDILTGISSTAYQQNYINGHYSDATGNAGSIDIQVNKDLQIFNHGSISSSTYSVGNAGKIDINAANIAIDAQDGDKSVLTGISSSAYADSKGNADNVTLNVAGMVKLSNGGALATDAWGQGHGGVITVNTGQLVIDAQGQAGNFFTGISAKANNSSTGQVGEIHVNASQQVTLIDGAKIAITNLSKNTSSNSLYKGLIDINTPILNIYSDKAIASNDNKSQINSASLYDKAASNILIHALQWLTLRNANITTSVSGKMGNGGDIRVNSPAVVLEAGSIQANTNALDGQGVQITVNTQALIPSGNTLNAAIFGYNSIQADAPHGINGVIHITSPQLNLSGVLINLQTANFEHQKIKYDVCHAGSQSSLTRQGRGALLPTPADMLGF